ncbi:hypothetical protein Acor_70720 [Acrocarpospora corrugata]|uniref:Lipoprotein n=1 Tax=Acrocarpospora corrugata TaxID=35763 RepID=A0A5M3W837_9ACTN|nr:hypothetical protein [Acrocarpospora corrugata]GES05004.1 hypothetical protein Acor_70720 [Acrocarpospora corrugata]
MRAAGTRMLACVTLLATVAACGQEPPVARETVTPPAQSSAPTPNPSPQGSDEPRKSDVEGADPSWFEGEVSLADGRRVAMHYRRGEGLFEQHYNPTAGEWTKPRLIYRTKTDACQRIQLQARGGTVTAIANFGRYCADGEPPTESIAAVAQGDLLGWDHHLTKNFDGWKRANITDDGRKATFVRKSTEVQSTLVWTSTGGFSDPVFKFR